MQEEDIDIAIKIVVVGNGGVGKSSLIRRFCKGTFTDQYKKTIGVDFLEKQLNISSLGETVTMMVWDTAGQEEFDSMTRAYYRGAAGAVLAFSTTDRQSYEAIEQWKNKVEAECGKIPMALIQNKIDLLDQAVLTKEEAEGTAKKLSLRFYRTSVRDNFNVNEVFEYLAEQYLKNRNKKSSSANSEAQIGSFNFDNKKDSKKDNSKKASKNSEGDNQEDGDEDDDIPKHKTADQQDNGKNSFQITQSQPEKRRTKGKKSMFQKCSLT